MGTRENGRAGDVAEMLTQRLAADPGDTEAYRSLCEHYRRVSDFASLANLIAGYASFTQDDREAGRAYHEVALLLEQSLHDDRRAEGFYRRALQRDPHNMEASECLQALLSRTGRLAELTELITAQLESLERRDADPRDQAVLCYRLGELWGKHFDRAEEALDYYRRAYELDPRLLRAIYEARLSYLALGDRRSAALLYEKEAAAEPDVARRGLLLRELGGLYAELDDLDGAVSALERARALTPDDVEVAHALATTLLERSKTLDERTRRADLDRVAGLLCEIAAALPDAEAVPFLTSALEHAPWHAHALDELERRTPQARAAEALAPFWVAYLTHSPEGERAEERRVSLARAYAALGQTEDAIFCVTPAAERGHPEATRLLAELRGTRAPSTRPARGATTRPAPPLTPEPTPDVTQISSADELSALRERARADSARPRPSEPVPHEPTELVAVPHPESFQTLDLNDVAALHRQLAELLAAGHTDEAVAIAERIAEIDPLDGEAFALLDRHFRRERDFARRAQLLARSAAAESLPIPTRKQRLREAANLFETRLSDIDAAIDAHSKLVLLEPDNADVVRSLRRLLERAKRWDELCALLEKDAATEPTAEAQVVPLRRLAEVHRRERSDREAAAKVLQRIVELDPDDRASRVTLTEDLIALSRFDDAAQLIERRIEQTPGKAERLPLLRQLAGVLETRLGDREAAFDVYERILEIVPDDNQALERMESIDEEAGAHERLLSTLARRAEHAAPTQAADIHVRMATVAEADLLDQDRALGFLRRALELAPSNLQILIALSNLYERAGRDAELLELLREHAQAEKNVKARADIHRRIGRLLAQRLNDQAAAAEAFAKVLEVAEDREALSFMEAHARAIGDKVALANWLGRLGEIATDKIEKRERWVERAECLVALGRTPEAVDTLVRVLCDVAPDDPRLLERLRQLCDESADPRGLARVLEHHLKHEAEPGARGRIARELADLYETKLPDETRALRALGEWCTALPDDPAPRRRLAATFERRRRYKELVAVLDELARVEPELADRHAALEQAAELCLSKLKDEAGAFQRVAMRVQTTVGPLDARVLQLARRAGRLAELTDLCEAEGRHDELFALLRERITQAADQDTKVALERRLAAALIEHREDEAGALDVYETLLSHHEDVDALRFVQAWALRHDDPARLEVALGRLARLEAHAADKRDLLYERGRLLATRLSRPAEAVVVLEEALALDGRFEPALDELISACEATGAHDKLAHALERWLGLAERSSADKVETLRRLVDLYRGPLADERRTLHALDRWVALAPDDPEPLYRIRDLHQRAGRFRELVATLDTLVQREPDEALRTAAQVQAAEVTQSALRDPKGAFTRLAPLVPLADAAADALLATLAVRTGRQNELFDLLEAAERHVDLAERLEAAAAATDKSDERVHWLLRAADVVDQRLQDVERAERIYARVLELEEHPKALRFMQARALRADDPAALATVLARLAAIETDPNERRDLLYEHAHLLSQRLGRHRDAIAVLKDILRSDAAFEPALDELASAAEAAADHASHADALTQLLAAEREPARRAELAERLADLCEGPLSAPERAIAALAAWTSADPGNLTPLRRTRALLTREGDASLLLSCLDAIAAHATDPVERREATFAAIATLRDVLHDPEQAWSRLLPLVEAGDTAADTQLRELAFANGKHDALADLYQRMGRVDELVELLHERADASTDANEKASFCLRCARLLAESVGDELAATEAYRDVLELREDPEALSYLRGVAERQDDVDALEDLLRRLAAVREDRADKRDLLLARALLLNDRLDRTAEAVEVLRQIVSTLDPSCMPAIDELIAAAEAVGNLQALAQGLERKLVLSRTPVERGPLALRLADLYEGELDNPDLAIEALRRYCEAEPQNAAGHRRLRARLPENKHPAELLAVLDALSRIEDTKAARHEALLAAAKLAHETLHDSPSAFARLSPLVLSGDGAAEHLAENIAKSAGLGRELAFVYIRRAQQAQDRDDARTSWRRVVHIHEDWLHEPTEAFEASLRLLALDTHDRAQLDEVDRLAVQLSAFPRLGQVYARLVKDARSASEQIELLVRLASLLEVQARDPAAALDLLMQACKLGPVDEGVLDRAEALTRRLGNHAELLWLTEQRAARGNSPATQVAALLEAARTADIGLSDREQANLCLRHALELTEHAPELARSIEELAGELDRARPAIGKDDARRALLRSHLEICEHASPAFRDALIARAARFVREDLGDEAGAFDLLRQGTSTAPCSDALLDALESSAVRIQRLDALNAHLSRVADRASDPADKRKLLTRRARVLDERLARFDQAAQAYERVLELDPQDEAACAKLFACLKKAGRYRELLHAFERRLSRIEEPAQKLPLLRQMAGVWEIDLKNRASAIEVWNEVRTLAPLDEEAERAIERLGARAV